MSRFSRGLVSLATRAGIAEDPQQRAERESRRSLGWRWPLDERLLRRLETVSLAVSRPAAGGLGGEHRSRARAASTDFSDYRPYLPGDDFRQIDWHAYGRLGQLFVKLTEARERLPLQLLLDCSASMNHGEPNKLDFARQVAAVIGYVGLARYDRVELVRMGGEGPPSRPVRGKHRFAELLSALDATRASGSMLDSDLASFRTSGRGGQVVLISDLLQPGGYESGLESLVSSGLQPSVLHVLSRDELEPPEGGDVDLQDLETGERVSVGLSPAAVGIYRKRLAEWCAKVESFCTSRGLRYLRLISDERIEQIALVDFRRAGLLH